MPTNISIGNIAFNYQQKYPPNSRFNNKTINIQEAAAIFSMSVFPHSNNSNTEPTAVSMHLAINKQQQCSKNWKNKVILD